MSTIRTAIAALCGTLLIASACAGRKPNPTLTALSGDENLSCEAIALESQGNAKRLVELSGEKDAKVLQNVLAGAAAVVFILPLFLMDFQDAPGVEHQALVGRQQRLEVLARTKGCQTRELESATKAQPAPAPGQSTATPACKDVGGYEKYMRETGQVCTL